MTESDAGELLRRAAGMPYGEARTILTERAVKVAEAGRDPGLLIEARLDLTSAYQYGGEPAKSFATFTRGLADHDAEPGRFDESQAHRLLWHFKWIMGDMRRFPAIPLRRALDALDDMERRYRIAGAPYAVHAERCLTAWHLGDEEAVATWMHRWATTPRDSLSDCEACDVSSRAWVLSGLGRDEEAVSIAEPVLSGWISCTSQPQSILSTLLLPYLRTGRVAEAANAHRRAYRLVQGRQPYLDDFGTHLEFLALTGNEARGLEILRRELPLLERPPSPAHALEFQQGAAMVLRRLEETGHADLTVRRGGRDVPVPALRAELEAGAREIAAAFDARNGSGVQTARLERALAAEPVGYVPLVPHARRDHSGDPVRRWREARGSTDLADAVAGFTARGDHRRAALARADLSQAYLDEGRDFDAAECAEEALALLAPPASDVATPPADAPTSDVTSSSDGVVPAGASSHAGDVAPEVTADAETADAVSRLSWTLARAHAVLGEWEAAVAAYTRIGTGEALRAAAAYLADRDHDAQAADLYARAADRYRAEGDHPAAARALAARATCVYYASEDGDAVMAAFAEARTAMTAQDQDLTELDADEAMAREWLREQDD